MIEHRSELWLLGWALSSALLWALYLRQRQTRNATLVDAGWAASLVLTALLYAAIGPGDASHRALIGAMVGIEYARIALLILVRARSGEEDNRYRELRRRWRERGREQRTFVIFYQAQALLAVLLSAPALLASFDRTSRLEPVAWAGAALWVVSASLEWTADRQLTRHKSDPANRGKTMRSGLWRYSRHPNYFFQTLVWVSFALVATASPWGWLAWLAPAAILYLIFFVTGVGPAEESSLRSRGEEYRRYQDETSIFVPWFRKAGSGLT